MKRMLLVQLYDYASEKHLHMRNLPGTPLYICRLLFFISHRHCNRIVFVFLNFDTVIHALIDIHICIVYMYITVIIKGKGCWFFKLKAYLSQWTSTSLHFTFFWIHKVNSDSEINTLHVVVTYSSDTQSCE